MTILLNINGVPRRIDADPEKPLLWALREDLGLVGTKFGCGAGLCGACTVHADGEAIRSCQTSIADAATRKITTIEHVATTDAGKRVAASWIVLDVPQCGYCQAGQIMSASALLARGWPRTHHQGARHQARRRHHPPRPRRRRLRAAAAE